MLINHFYKRNINAGKKDKMNESSKQTWTIKTTKLIIAQNKYQCQQKQNRWLLNKRPMLTTSKWMIPKIKCQCYEHANELLLKKKYQWWE